MPAQLGARAGSRSTRWSRGNRLILLLDDARALRDIPAAAEACGYAALDPEEAEGHWRLVIEV